MVLESSVINYYVDESGNFQLFKKTKVPVSFDEGASKVLMLGLLEVRDGDFSKSFDLLKRQICIRQIVIVYNFLIHKVNIKLTFSLKHTNILTFQHTNILTYIFFSCNHSFCKVIKKRLKFVASSVLRFFSYSLT